MTPLDFVDVFVVPLVIGGEVTLGLPTGRRFQAELATIDGAMLADRLEPATREVVLGVREVWAGAPKPVLGHAFVDWASLVHDVLVALHPFGAGGLPDRYVERLAERLTERLAARPPRDPLELAQCHVLVRAALAVERHDPWVRFKLLGELRGRGRAPRWIPFPWRVVESQGTSVVTLGTTLPPALRALLEQVSPLWAAETLHDETDLRVLAPLLEHAPMARHLARCLSSVERRQVLATLLAAEPRLRRVVLRRMLGLVLYAHIEHPDGVMLEPFWRDLVAATAPHAAALGAPHEGLPGVPAEPPLTGAFEELAIRVGLAPPRARGDHG